MQEEDNLTIGVVSLDVISGRFFLHRSGVLVGKHTYSSPDRCTLSDGTKFLLLHRPESVRGLHLDQVIVVVDPQEQVFLVKEELIRESLVSLNAHSCVPEELQYVEYRL